jgi:hypothetical protein
VSATPLTAEAASLIEKKTLGGEILMVSQKVRIRHAGSHPWFNRITTLSKIEGASRTH